MVVRKTIALLASAALAAGTTAYADQAAPWTGHSTQGYLVKAAISPSGTLVSSLRARYALECSDGSSVVRRLALSRATGDTIVIDDTGRFATTGTVAGGLADRGSGSLTYRVSGRVKANRITGLLRVSYVLDSGVRCDTDIVGFVLRES